MKLKTAIGYGLGSSAGVFVGMFGYSALLKNDPSRGLVTGLIAAFLVLVVWSVIALCQREKTDAADSR